LEETVIVSGSVRPRLFHRCSKGVAAELIVEDGSRVGFVRVACSRECFAGECRETLARGVHARLIGWKFTGGRIRFALDSVELVLEPAQIVAEEVPNSWTERFSTKQPRPKKTALVGA